MTTKEDHQSNAPNDDRSQSCGRRLILWSDSEDKGYASASKDRIKEIIDYLKKETIWIPNVRFSRESKPSCANESQQLMDEEKLLKFPRWKRWFSDNLNLLKPPILEGEIDKLLKEGRQIKSIPTIMIMVPSSEAGFRGLLKQLTAKTAERFRGNGSKKPPFVALLQHKSEDDLKKHKSEDDWKKHKSKDDWKKHKSLDDWKTVRSLTNGDWKLVKCFPEVEGKGGDAGTPETSKRKHESFSEGENPGTLTGNSGKEGRKYISIENNSVARTGIQGTPTKEVVAPPAPAPTPPQISEKKPGPIKKAKR